MPVHKKASKLDWSQKMHCQNPVFMTTLSADLIINTSADSDKKIKDLQ